MSDNGCDCPCHAEENRCLECCDYGEGRIRELEAALRKIAEHPHCQSDLPDPMCHCDSVLSDYMSTHGMSEWAI